jgi:hypothetical protein
MRAIVFGAFLLAMASSNAGQAASSSVIAGPGSFTTSWITPVAVVQPDQQPVLLNRDLAFHGLESVSVGSDDAGWCGPANPGPEGPTNPRRYPLGSCPLFWADVVPPLSGTTPILGLEAVSTGTTYAFHCPIHPNMRGLVLALP